jgi:Copper transport outer membrane protein, MctB
VINFRYHVVSLTAVFLALAIGLVVGTSALNGPLSDELKHQVTQLTRTNNQYRGQVTALENEVAQKEQFAVEAAPALLGGKLTGRRVLVVSMQNSHDYVADTVADLKMAGAKVTGTVEVEDLFVKPASNETLLDLAANSVITSIINGLPANSDGVETSAALLAAVLMDHTPAVPTDAATTVLTAYEKSSFIAVDGKVSGPAEAVVFLAPAPYSDEDASAENANVVTTVDQFDKVGAIVVGAASDAGQGNVIPAITGEAILTKSVSTVDNINTPAGRIAAALAVHEKLLGNTGHYGIASSATSLLPSASPS